MSIVGTRPPLISETNLYEPRHKVNLGSGYWISVGDSKKYFLCWSACQYTNVCIKSLWC